MKLKIFYTIMDALFLLIAPLVFVLAKYGRMQTGALFKLEFGGILIYWLIDRALLSVHFTN